MRIKLIGIVAGAALAVSACGGGYDRQEFIDDLQDEGIDEATATCIADGAEARIGEERLGERDDPTAEEEQVLIEITTECILGG